MRKYKTFNYPGSTDKSKTLLTGIREKGNGTYLISGFYEPTNTSNEAISFLYEGKLNGKGKWKKLSFHGKNTNLYGPNYTENGEIQVVGNYFVDVSIGCLYQGTFKTGKWTIILPPFSSGALNTIVHSNSGNLAVGNYDVSEQQNVSKAFIYDIETGNYYKIEREGALSISAYGIVHIKKDKYCICGGFIENIIGRAYLVDFDRKTKEFSNWRVDTFNNQPDLVTHFDGIALNDCGEYTLTGDYIDLSDLDVGFFAVVNADGKVKWESLHYPGSLVTSGNSVSGNVVIGVYKNESDSKINGYISK